MSAARADERPPDPARVLSRLKDFQLATVEHVFKRMYLDEDAAHRFLVADEVGLGKTMIAKGLIAKALEHLWDTVERLDVVYVCSNADIARQNLNRLNVLDDESAARPTRLTLLPSALAGMKRRKVNFLSFTPGTSFDLRSTMGQRDERVLLYHLLSEAWELGPAATLNVFRGDVNPDTFSRAVDRFDDSGTGIDKHLKRQFLSNVRAAQRPDRTALNLKRRFQDACASYVRSNSRVSNEDRKKRSTLIADLRRVLAKTCIRSLEPDLVILDEFQRFRHLLDRDSDDEGAMLAQELFDYGSGNTKARVVLLSATPYKMYTMDSSEDDGDHHEDFTATLRFLFGEARDAAESRATRVQSKLGEMRVRLMRGQGSVAELSAIARDVERELSRVMVRTERLACSGDRNGMLKEVVAPNLPLTAADALVCRTMQSLADELGQSGAIEYWKAAPFLPSMMDRYKLKKVLEERLKDDAHSGVAAMLRAAISRREPISLHADELEARQPIEPAHPRMRWMSDDAIAGGAWRLLWIPAAAPYYEPCGVFGNDQIKDFTKRLVFSNWNVVPKSIATLLSHEVERRILPRNADHTLLTKQIEAARGGLRLSAVDNKPTAMTTLLLCYPSIALAHFGDPLRIAAELRSDGSISLAQVRAECSRCIRAALDGLGEGQSASGPPDARWYWAAPILLDLLKDDKSSADWLLRDGASSEWLGAIEKEGGDAGSTEGRSDEEHSGWSAHVRSAADFVASRFPISTLGGEEALGRQPDDLAEVLSMVAIASPAICTLRSLTRMDPTAATNASVRDSAGRVAHAFRGLFNLPDAGSVVRETNTEQPFWRSVLDYCANGNLQSVLDEYVHVLRETEGLQGRMVRETADELATRMREAIGLRTSNLTIDEVVVGGNSRVSLRTHRMRVRFAMRFGDRESTEDEEATRSESVRVAFNSPFWPFVLATTSVGQEGLDFHLYCHAVVHWNLPSNPVDLEQREGRVHRYKNHAVRRNVARAHGGAIFAAEGRDPWDAIFDSARAARAPGASDLTPYWLYPIEGGACIERHLPHLPLSREIGRAAALRRTLACYRMAFGQPRQTDLLEAIAGRVDTDLAALADVLINLSPPAIE